MTITANEPRTDRAHLLTSIVALTAATLGCTSHVAAQSFHPSGVTVEHQAWHFKAIYEDTASGPVVLSIVALAAPGTTRGDNLVAVWYLRPTRQGDSWTAKSWYSVDPTEVVKSIKATLGIPDEDDYLWGLDPDADLMLDAETETASDYDKGLLVQDPLYPVVATLSNPDALIETLKTVGYRVADPHFEMSSSLCGTDTFLNEVASAAESVLQDANATSQQVFANWLATDPDCAPVGGAIEVIPLPTRTLPRTWTPRGVTGCWGGPAGSGNSYYTGCTTVISRRTVGRRNPMPPPTFDFCDQTRTQTTCRTYFCVVPCPGTPQPPTPPCPSPTWSLLSIIDSTYTDSGWTPPCPWYP